MYNNLTFSDPGVKAAGIENLACAKAVLESLGISYWLCCGTLLGLHRDNDLIPHDSDIDLGVMIEDFSDLLLPAMLEHDFLLEHQFGSRECGFEFSLRRKGIKLDIFWHYRSENGIWMAVWSGPRMAKYLFPHIEKIETVDFFGHRYPVPSNREAFIEAQYGADWRIPRPDWHFFRSPHNLSFTQ